MATSSGRRAERHLAEAASSRWAEWAGRAGYVARGVVYAVTGVLCVLSARGATQEHDDPLGAIATMAVAPLGRAAVALVGLGLVAYSLWQLAQGTLDPAGRGRSAKAIAARIGYALSAIFYGPLAWAALRAATKGGVERRAHAEEVRLLELPWGRFALGAIGVAVLVTALIQLYIGVRATFREELDLARAPRLVRGLTIGGGVVGFVARAGVFAIVGGFLLDAAITLDPQRAHSIGGAVREVLRAPHGAAAVVAIGIGLVAFGAFSLLAARYHRAPRAHPGDARDDVRTRTGAPSPGPASA